MQQVSWCQQFQCAQWISVNNFNFVINNFNFSLKVQDGKQVLLSGQEVETILKEKFWRDSGILGASISDIRTTICQNTCSGHGVCNSETRVCLCETFWMPDIFYFWGVSEANCGKNYICNWRIFEPIYYMLFSIDWSILYVIIGVFIGFLFLSGVCWGITCLCRRSYKPRGRSKIQKYALLGTQEDETSHSKSQCKHDLCFIQIIFYN